MNNTSFISDALVRALGWTLVHSLWQGALAALVLLVLLPRLQTARQRYWAGYGSLLAVFAAGLITFGWVWRPESSAPVSQVFSQEGQLLSQYFIDSLLVEPDFWQKITNWLEANYSFIVAVWLLGFGFFLLRLASGLWHVHRLSKRGVSPVESFWEERMAALGRRLGMSRPVRLLESALVHAPVTIGWLKPVVLLPVGLVNRLSPAEVEAVLAHELAHIARRDWLFNLMQAFIETIFYYNPAVWWMSQVIRNERENCCDDAALTATGNRLAFAKALVQVQEMAKPVPALALGMNGSGRPLLLERVRRILNQPQQKSQIMEKFTATVILLALLTLVGIRANNAPSLTAAFAQMTEFPAVLFGAQDDENEIANDSVPKPKSTRKIVREDDDQRVEAEYQDNRLTRLNIDGKEIPTSEFDQHRDLTNELRRELRAPIAPMPLMPPGVFFFSPGAPAMAPMPALPPMPPLPPMPQIFTEKDGDGNTIIRLQRDGEPVEIKVKDGQVWVNGDKLEEGEKLDLPGFSNGFFYWNDEDGNGFNFTPEAFHFEGMEGLEGLSEEDRANWEEEAARLSEEAEELRQEHHELMQEHQRISEEDRKRFEKEAKEGQKEWAKEQKRWEKEQKQWAKEQEKWAKEQEKWAHEQSRWADEQAKAAVFGKELKAQLQRDGLITDPTNFQFQLSNKELKVNGVKQSADLHRKYLELYRAKTGKDFGENGNFYWTESN